jgi:hypothetical protein
VQSIAYDEALGSCRRQKGWEIVGQILSIAIDVDNVVAARVHSRVDTALKGYGQALGASVSEDERSGLASDSRCPVRRTVVHNDHAALKAGGVQGLMKRADDKRKRRLFIPRWNNHRIHGRRLAPGTVTGVQVGRRDDMQDPRS